MPLELDDVQAAALRRAIHAKRAVKEADRSRPLQISPRDFKAEETWYNQLKHCRIEESISQDAFFASVSILFEAV